MDGHSAEAVEEEAVPVQDDMEYAYWFDKESLAEDYYCSRSTELFASDLTRQVGSEEMAR